MAVTFDARSTAVNGLNDAASRVNDAAKRTVEAYKNASNRVSERPVVQEAAQAEAAGNDAAIENAGMSAETFQAANELADTDVVTPQIDMMQAKHAYEANLKVMETVNDMESELMDVLK